MKRTYRNDMSAAQKMKLSAANTGKRHSESTKQKIAKSMEEYWSGLPYKPTDSGTTGNTGSTPNGYYGGVPY